MLFFPDCSTVIRDAPRLFAGAPRPDAGAPRCSQACCQRSQAYRRPSQVLPDAPNVLSGAPRCSQTYHNHSHGTPVAVISDPSYSEGWPECPPRVWYSPEIDASKFTLHILSDTPGVFQWLKYILLISVDALLTLICWCSNNHINHIAYVAVTFAYKGCQ